MVIFEKKVKTKSDQTTHKKYDINFCVDITKLHRLKKISSGEHAPKPPSKAHGFAMRSKFSQLKKKSWPPPPKSWLRPRSTLLQ